MGFSLPWLSLRKPAIPTAKAADARRRRRFMLAGFLLIAAVAAYATRGPHLVAAPAQPSPQLQVN
jgi:hypothetical protein